MFSWISLKRITIDRRGLLAAFIFISSIFKKYDTYRDLEQEARYWAAAEAHGKRLRPSDAKFAGSRGIRQPETPLVTYYTPAILPYYREGRRKFTPEYHLSLRAIFRWHRMVFRGPLHPTVSQAFQLRKSLSSEDRRELHRISRMLPDEKVFGPNASPWNPKYHKMWQEWLSRRDRGLVFAY
ncbi:hypothetical protein C8J57DRAFT_1397744 [Mycena rebaudengoi]|nr:hypothetical protein C8J57DRAFT_1397744 [Mycena rebaudengoi]